MNRIGIGFLLCVLVLILPGCAHLNRGEPFDRVATAVRQNPSSDLPPAYTIHPDVLAVAAYQGASVEVAPWYRFLPAAISLTFDDGTLDQYVLGFPELEARRQKATFFLISGRVGIRRWRDGDTNRVLFSWQQARRLAIAGHEIGSHGISHRELKGAAPMTITRELRDSQSKIQEEIPGRYCVSFCWPYWRSDASSRKASEDFYIGARVGGGLPEQYFNTNGGIPTTPLTDLQQINSFGLLPAYSTEPWREIGERVLDSRGWMVLNFHGIDDGIIPAEHLGWQPLPIEVFRLILDYVSEQNAWSATFGQVLRYVKERENLRVTLNGITKTTLALKLQDSLVDDVFDQTLTLRMQLPPEWEDADVLQAGHPVWHRLDDDGRIVFDATPDRGLVELKRKLKKLQ